MNYELLIDSYKKKGNITLIDKKNKKSYITYVKDFEDGGITNDFDGGINFQPVSYYSEMEMEYMIGFFNPYQLKNHVASAQFINSVPKYIENKSKVENLAKTLTETDNPVLMLIKLKN
ncbi:MAG TPA: hypothetical protein PK727_05230 [Bacteroidales bacterium]|jgi:hypothetical protein|nr:hypothetical protein [Lentimicrobiaceae bacterium]MZP66958.1 hypothetical protein [Bacteroidales bacterium]HNY52507.1 hypothetical protein [Bacteroidales bacterium]HOG56713.1 hypothetical protein [Bacteroidales bacterium]HQB87047.1 hypothetical protein [Bacteroidales bacterium]